MAPTLYDEKPELGDLIEIFRGNYQHWAMYIGDGYIVHLAPPTEDPGSSVNSVMSVFYEKAVVKREKLWDVAGTNEWQINNGRDSEYKPRAAAVIVKEARELVGQEIPYCVFRGNCEHFATELRYGKSESRQVEEADQVFMAAGAATVLGLGLGALAGTFFGSGSKEKKNTQKVQKAGEVLVAAGAATVLGLGLVALAGAFFGSGSKEKKNTQ